jgi:hypothetical protein
MALDRYICDLPIPLTTDGKLPPILLQKPTAAQLNAMSTMTWAQIIRTMIRRLKDSAVDIQGTGPMVERARAVKHLCHHDQIPPLPCESEEPI